MTKARNLAALLAFLGAFAAPALANQPGFDGVTKGEDSPSTVDLHVNVTAPKMESGYQSQEAVEALVQLESALERGEMVPGEIQEKLAIHGEEWLSAYQSNLQGDNLELDAFYEVAMNEQQSEGASAATSYEVVARKIQGVELALSRYMLARSLVQNSSGYRTIRPRSGNVGLDESQQKQAAAYFAAVREDLLKQSREIRAVLQQG